MGSPGSAGLLASDAQLPAPNTTSALGAHPVKGVAVLNEHSLRPPPGQPQTQPARPQLRMGTAAQGGDSLLHSWTGAVSGPPLNSEREELSGAGSQGTVRIQDPFQSWTAILEISKKWRSREKLSLPNLWYFQRLSSGVGSPAMCWALHISSQRNPSNPQGAVWRCPFLR